jgi:TetR/AcrR family transcriptional regulator, transcriptional repressor for nem operon
MRYGADHKSGSRNRILRAAAQQIRMKGPNKIAVSEVMTAAGLTHGAFYAHFSSKDDLVAEAVAVMFADASQRASGLEGVLAEDDSGLPAAFRTYLEGYLSARHRDGPERGCPLPSLAADIGRTESRARDNFVAGMQRMTAGVETVLMRMGRAQPDAEARAVVAQMVGAIGLARAAGPGDQSDAILRDCLAALIAKLDL